MRALSKWEKEIIAKLCEGRQYLSNFYSEELLKDTVLELTTDSYNGETKLDIHTKSSDIEYQGHKMVEITEATARLASFLSYLERENYIFRYIPSHGRLGLGTIALNHVREDFIASPTNFTKLSFPDEKVKMYILNNVNCVFQSNQALIEYKNANYRTPEQIRHNQNISIAIIAIGISLVLGLVGILSSVNFSDICGCYY